MDTIKDKLYRALENNNINIDNITSVSEALEKLLVYCEEIKCQNSELKKKNKLIEKLNYDYRTLF